MLRAFEIYISNHNIHMWINVTQTLLSYIVKLIEAQTVPYSLKLTYILIKVEN